MRDFFKLNGLCYSVIRLSGFLQGIDQANQFLGGMGDCDIIMLALGSFLGEISSEARIPKADIFGRVEQCEA